MPPKKVKLSATRISTFLQCKKRYWLGYVKRVEKPDNPVFKLGLACHEALEYAGNLWMTEDLQEFTDEHKKDILVAYHEHAVKEGIEEYEGVVEGRELVEARINNFALGRKIVGLELKFGFPKTKNITTDAGIPLIGAIDKLVELDSSTLLVIDYKTSKSVPDTEKLKTDMQLSMYNMVVKKLYPEYDRIVLGLDMLRKGDIVYTYRTDEELAEFEEYLTAIHKEMSSLKEKDAVPSVNFLCGWCDYRNVCDKYNDICANSEFNFMNINNLSDNELISQWEDVRSTQKILETRERELADAIIDKIKVKELPVKGEEKEMVLRQNSRTTYDPIKVSQMIPPEDFAKLVNLSPTKLRKYLDKNTKVKPFVEETAETNFTSAFLASRKLRK